MDPSFDLHLVGFRSADFVSAAQRLFSGMPEVTCENVDVKSIPVARTGFVSPANSIGFMDGGVDAAYSRLMFPGVEADVKAAIRRVGLLTHLGRPYLPIGSAIVVPTAGGSSALVSAPTMFLPHDVSQTENAYHAFMAALMAFQKFLRTADTRFQRLVCPALCTGYGKMPAEQAAEQMHRAYCDFREGKTPLAVMCQKDSCAFITAPTQDACQPRNFDNREIQDVQNNSGISRKCFGTDADCANV